jgi:hypothetical protein
LKNLPPRPPQKPSGMDKATDRGGSGGGDKSAAGEKSRCRRGSQLDKLTIGASSELAARWAQDALTKKNSLTAEDAKLVEEVFEKRLSELPPSDAVAPETKGAAIAPIAPTAASAQAAAPQDSAAGNSSRKREPDTGGPIDKSVLAVGAPRRYRNREHLRTIATQPCLICGRKPSDPHHLRYAQPRALGRKASDEFAVPLCRMHHREVHRANDKRAWWKAARIDPLKVARKFWRETRVDEGRIAPSPPPKAADQDQLVEAREPNSPIPA